MAINIIRKLIASLFILILISASLAFANEEEAFDFEFDFGFGKRGIGKGKFDFPVDVAVDSKDNIYVIDQGNSRVQKFDDDGDYITEWGGEGAKYGKFDMPVSIYIDKKDYVYIVEALNHRISKFDSDGNFIRAFGSLGTRRERFKEPYDMDMDDNGNIYVADAKNDRIQKFTYNFSYIRKWGKEGTDDEEFQRPSSIKFVDYKFGYLYISNLLNCTVQRFELNGDFENKFVLSPPKEHIDIDVEKNEDENGGDEDENGGDEAQGQCGIKRMVVDEYDDYLLVIFNNDNAVYKFDYDGKYVAKLTKGDDIEFNNPTSVYVAKRYLLVVDGGNNYIHKFKRR